MYPLAVHPDIVEQQSKLKEILYDCAVELRATKAALYLFDEQDGKYDLVTEYGFRGVLRNAADSNDPVVDRCGRSRTPFFVNGLMAEPRFSEILYESSTDRMLVAPIYQRGRLVGFVDMRDKAAKQPFENADLPKAQQIADRVAELFATKNVFGHRYIQLSTTTSEHAAFTGPYAVATAPAASAGPQAAPAAPPAPAPAPPVLRAVPAAAPVALVNPPPAPGRVIPRISELIAEGQAAVVGLHAPAADALTEAEMIIARDFLRVMLLIPGVIATSFAVAGQTQEIVATRAMGDDAIDALQSRLMTWLQKRGETGSFPKRNVIGTGTPALTANDVQKVFTAPINAAGLKGLYLTVAFTADPDRAAHDLLASTHRQLQSAIDQSMQRRGNDVTRRRIAERLLEPDFIKYPELRRHTEHVVRRVDMFARFLALSPAEIENARLVSIVHDVGMRLLEYDRLYRKRNVSHDELELLRNHSVIGAALVEPFLGREVARAVLSHHERWDGGGYPEDIRGAAIPLLSRVLQICDVYESMVQTDNYQTPQTHDQAMTVISRGAGIQFDPELAGRFIAMMQSNA